MGFWVRQGPTLYLEGGALPGEREDPDWAWAEFPLEGGFTLGVALYAREYRQALRGQRQAGVLALLPILLLASLLGLYLSGSITRPLRQLAQATEALARMEFQKVPTPRSRDEVGVLARNFHGPGLGGGL